MVAVDEDALICDMAETYHILDMYRLPVELLATLACGLRDNSRIKLKFAGVNHPLETLLLASVVDSAAWIRWSKTKDAEKGINMPVSIFNQLVNPPEKKKAFASGAEFDEAKRNFDKLAKRKENL